jgi:hypothetical protein
MQPTEDFSCALLPPPVETILFYAAWGLSFHKKRLAPSGRPLLGERIAWVPEFYERANSPEGLKELKALAQDGLRAWGLCKDTIEALDGAFGDGTFRVRIIKELEKLAATAREPFTLAKQNAPTRKTPPQTEAAPAPSVESEYVFDPGPDPAPSRPGARQRTPETSPS